MRRPAGTGRKGRSRAAVKQELAEITEFDQEIIEKAERKRLAAQARKKSPSPRPAPTSQIRL